MFVVRKIVEAMKLFAIASQNNMSHADVSTFPSKSYRDYHGTKNILWGQCFDNFSGGDTVFLSFTYIFCGVAVFRAPHCPPPARAFFDFP